MDGCGKQPELWEQNGTGGGGVRTHLPLAVTGRVDLEIVLAGAWRSVLTLS